MNDWKKKFIIIWTGQLFSILSSSIAQFSIILWISLKTGSAEVLSFATIAGMLPQIVIGPFAGVLVDRWSRKWTMITADMFVAFCSAIMAILFYFDMMPIWAIYCLLMLRSVGGAFHIPAMKSSTPLLAPQSELNRIAGINQTIQSVSAIGGPVIGAILMTTMSMTTVMLLDVLGATIACAALLFVTIPNPIKTLKKPHIFREMKEGFLTIKANRGISWVMLIEVIGTFFIMPIVALLPLMTINNFNGGAYEVGLVEMLFGVGALIGGALMGVWNPKIKRVYLISGSYLLYGIAFAISGLLSKEEFIAYAVVNLIQGIILPFYIGPFTALLQTQIPVEFQGRVFSLFDSIAMLPSIFGLLALGFIAQHAGLSAIFIIGGVAIMLISIPLVTIASVKNMEK